MWYRTLDEETGKGRSGIWCFTLSKLANTGMYERALTATAKAALLLLA
jgi:hypothetical protein